MTPKEAAAVLGCTWQHACYLCDGVDTLFDENDKAMSPGTEGFVEYWEDSLNENREETIEAYFPELIIDEQTEAGYDKLASGWIGG